MSLITVAAGAARFLLLLLLSPPGNVHLLSEGTFMRLSESKRKLRRV